MKIAYIGTYPPRECGIGTFTQNKLQAMMSIHAPGGQGHEAMVVAVSNQEVAANYPNEVAFVIRQSEYGDYAAAARFINESGASICVLEHEFGIYGGQSGVYILSLMHNLKIPCIVVLHTVLKKPSYSEHCVTVEMAKMAGSVVVMSTKAIEFLTTIYGVQRKRIALIEHGVPDLAFEQETAKRIVGMEGKKLLLTFGLIGRNKGIETVIKALPPIVEKHPDVVYLVLGKTHPGVLRHSGEEYREYLKQLVDELGLLQNVCFLNDFVDEQQLFTYLSAADIYVTPYLNEAQITSGTLSYAVGAGCAVVSTPYWHATELLAEKRGLLFGFNDTKALSNIFLNLLDKPQEMAGYRERAFKYGREITWPKVAERYLMLANTLLKQHTWATSEKKIVPELHLLPGFTLEHIQRLTDSTGIAQHAKFGIPNWKEGYCVDDNARALLMVLMANQHKKSAHATQLLGTYLSFIYYMQNDNGTFKNFMSFSRGFLDEVGSEDCFGRTMWALGYLLCHAPNDAMYQVGREMFFKALPNCKNMESVRGVANTIIGLCYYLKSNPNDVAVTELMQGLCGRLLHAYGQYSTADWQWFEPVLTYDNAVLPLCLLEASEILHDTEIEAVAFSSMNFLTSVTMSQGYLSVVGNEEWFEQNGTQSVFAQQPIDAMMMTLMYTKAFELTKDVLHLDYIYKCFQWFLGENDLRVSLYDYDTKGCCDGLESYGVNRNQGAESTLSFAISHLTVLQVFGQGHLEVKSGANASRTKEGLTRPISMKEVA